MLHALISHPPWYLGKSTSYAVPHYAVLFSLMSPHLSPVQIFSSAPWSQTPSVYVHPLIPETKIHTHKEPQAKLILYVPIFTFLDSWWDDKRFWTDSLEVLLEFDVHLFSSWSKFSFDTVIKKYWNCITYSKGLLTLFIYRFCPTFWWRDSDIYLLSSRFTCRPTSLLASIKVFVIPLQHLCYLPLHSDH
jgi:hypothetical protein